jgi:hypothetical protein
MIASCDWGVFGNGVVVQNDTSTPLTFELVGSDGKLRVLVRYPLRPGLMTSLLSRAQLGRYSLLTRDGCTFSDVVARDPDGNEVARRAPPLCEGDTWTVVDAGSGGRGLARHGSYDHPVTNQAPLERYFEALAAELNEERAAVLGRFGRRVEQALAKCAAEQAAADDSDAEALGRYRAARLSAQRAIADFCLQREMLGLIDHSWVDRTYPMPPAR